MAGLEALQPRGGVQTHGENLLRRAGRHLFNVHAAGDGSHDHDLLPATIHQQTQIEFPIDGRPLLDVDRIHRQPRGTALLGHQPGAQHGRGMLSHLCCRAGQLHAAGLTATPRVDLGLHDPQVTAQLLRRRGRRVGAGRRQSGGHRDTEIGKQRLGLVFMQIHTATPFTKPRYCGAKVSGIKAKPPV